MLCGGGRKGVNAGTKKLTSYPFLNIKMINFFVAREKVSFY
jgi:hypothetical protein